MAEESEDSSASSTQMDEEPTIDTVGESDTGTRQVDEGNTANAETAAVAEEEEGCSEVVDEMIITSSSTEAIAIAVDVDVDVAASEPSLYEQYDTRKILKGAAGGTFNFFLFLDPFLPRTTFFYFFSLVLLSH